MLSWFSANLSTILVSLVLLAVVIGIIASLRKDRKKRKIPLRRQLRPLSNERLLPQKVIMDRLQ
jgi:hypothetical protein